MRVLLLYPLFPKSFWSFDKALELIGRKVSLPPLSLTTVAAILPQTWEFRLVDRNVGYESEADWYWADLVIISGMIVQKEDMLHLIEAAKRRGKRVAVGGPYVTSVPDAAQVAGADFLVLDEGEITLPLLVEALERGETTGVFRSNGEKPDVTTTPLPRFDLLNLNAYSDMSVQFSRGCPYQCEFCDIIVLYGRKPRTKTPAQLLAELQKLYDLGWRRSIFVVDDNFIGNKRNAKLMLRELAPWMAERGYPFSFSTEASVDLAQDQELLDLMIAANFGAVFLGIETPDTDSLSLTQKFQNTRNSLIESVQTINRSGLRVMAGFIIGFDGEKSGAGDRIIDFVEATAIPQAHFSMLQALPNTALSQRLQKEGRLLETGEANIHQTTLINFVPTRPLVEIAHEYVRCFWDLYEPDRYLARVYRHFIDMKPKPHKKKFKLPALIDLRALFIICWRQGLKRNTRWQFWQQLFSIIQHNPGVFKHYLTNCAHLEHFIDYRQIVRDEIEAQLIDDSPIESKATELIAPRSA
ncbi:B12-binding domain-containing radical SAM protein [Leptolyngbya sp. FACHB-671]|uniref:B12-binding domain-containing radical SAM protein n=1 Tax=Leptolyngbya sp. FACHB-671 TaxID=2692812 RepID=UPI0016827776|nr:B12-binding domain-containing radical SAM protein [Leptolyngbya sp. FACHB-671]MBD1865962.1 B12-binding domain-containing radical SAM protein [Cyanobacteria bacterium FACHB-471]MBD2066704.1 B12-binding domain-containing radical SAM protein [Leptolyngbya sp. FACHB-671]